MKQPSLLDKLTPFLGIGIMLVFFIVALIFLSYIFIIGAVLGLALFTIAWIRSLFAKKSANHTTTNEPPSERIGNVYDHDEFDR